MGTQAEQIIMAINNQAQALRDLRAARSRAAWVLCASVLTNLILAVAVAGLAWMWHTEPSPPAIVMATHTETPIPAPADPGLGEDATVPPQQPVRSVAAVENHGPLPREDLQAQAFTNLYRDGIVSEYDPIDMDTRISLGGIPIGTDLWLMVSGSTKEHALFGVLMTKGRTVRIARGFMSFGDERVDFPTSADDVPEYDVQATLAFEMGHLSMSQLDAIADAPSDVTMMIRDDTGHDWQATFDGDDRADIVAVREAMRDELPDSPLP